VFFFFFFKMAGSHILIVIHCEQYDYSNP